jgi:hypothetical protein
MFHRPGFSRLPPEGGHLLGPQRVGAASEGVLWNSNIEPDSFSVESSLEAANRHGLAATQVSWRNSPQPLSENETTQVDRVRCLLCRGAGDKVKSADRARDLMRPEDILYWLKPVPFKPFRICLNSGRTYEIRHPEMLRVSRSTMHIFSFTGEPEDPLEKMEMVGLVLVELIGPLEAPSHA